ncbi:MAG: adenylate/guanylate cyclase domain-containing protein [Arcobacteraceae bacterium]|nr:adenylate/guanylate cyclase domain-containing protein [Arcobacteraceae bacterium]
MKKRLQYFYTYLISGFILSVLLIIFYVFAPSTINSLDSSLRDYMFVLRGEIPQSNNVVVVDLDNKSLKEVGQWPWSRDIFADLLVKLTNANVGIIGLDIVFAENDRSSPHLVFDKMGLDTKDVPNYDDILAYVVSQTPTILGYQFELEKSKALNFDSPKVQSIIIQRAMTTDNDFLIEGHGTILNINQLEENSYSSGFFNNIPDDSGIIRSVPLVIKYDDMIYPSLALEIIRVVTGEKKIYLDYGDVGVESVTVGEYKIPTDMFGRALVNFRGKERTFKYISAVDILNNNFEPEDLDGKIVLIGTSASGLLDLRATPFESVFPGVEVHANLIDNILVGDFISKPSWADGANIVHIFVIVMLSIIIIAYLPILLIPFVFMIVIGLDWYFLYDMFFEEGTVLSILMPLLAIVSGTLVVILINNFFIEKSSKLIKSKFASKVSPAVMEDILSSEGDVLAGKAKNITIFFSDLRNFTNISEALHDPKILIQFLNEYMTPMSDIIIKNHGTIDKFIGDAIMAYWNAPADVSEHQDKALVSALEQLYALKDLNNKVKADIRFDALNKMCEAKQIEPIDIGIGINSGLAIVGEMGSSGRSDYTIIGDAVNIGSRLESLCKYYNSKINISNLTKSELQGKYIFRFLDLVTVKGKTEPLEIWQVIDFDTEQLGLYDISKDELIKELDTYHQAIELYKQSKFADALKVFEELEDNDKKTNKAIYGIYKERCEHYIKEPPPSDFDGVFRHTSKG